MWVYHRDTLRFLAVNDAAVARYGYARPDFLRMTLADVIVPAANGDNENMLQRHRTKHSNLLLAESTTYDLVVDEHPARLTVINDVTARARLEDEREQLLEREQRNLALLIDAVTRKDETLALLDSLLAAAPIGFAFLDNDLRYLRINPSLARINGRTEAEHLGRTVRELFPGLAPTVEQVYQQIMTTGEPLLDVEVHGSPRNTPDDVRDYLVSYYPVRAPDGHMLGMGTIVLDITDRTRAEAERTLLLEREQAARAAAEQALNVREQFLSLASHELKTPLTALLGYSSLLQKRTRQGQPVGQREQRAIGAIAHQTNRLYELVAALLDLSRIETGQLVLQHQPVDLALLAQHVVDELHPTLTVHHRLHFVRPRQPVVVLGDDMRLEQVLQNLLHNAIKYSPNGGALTVRVTQHGDEARLSVSDEGIGIPQDAQAQLFQRFFRAANVGEQHISGLGIGLYVAREIVARHGGTIDVRSSENAGATFTVRLPLARDEDGDKVTRCTR